MNETQQTLQRQNIQIEQFQPQIDQLTTKSDENQQTVEQLQPQIDQLATNLNGTQQTLQRQNVQIAQLQSQPDLLYRTCEDLRSFGRNSGSGGYWIDPDGVAIGDPPIYVQCNMTTGSSITPNATTRQWMALMKLSQSCTLGNLECSGRATVNQIPATCEDLWKVGHTLNGLYDVKSNKAVRSVYCDFTKLPGDQGDRW